MYFEIASKNLSIRYLYLYCKSGGFAKGNGRGWKIDGQQKRGGREGRKRRREFPRKPGLPMFRVSEGGGGGWMDGLSGEVHGTADAAIKMERGGREEGVVAPHRALPVPLIEERSAA